MDACLKSGLDQASLKEGSGSADAHRDLAPGESELVARLNVAEICWSESAHCCSQSSVGVDVARRGSVIRGGGQRGRNKQAQGGMGGDAPSHHPPPREDSAWGAQTGSRLASWWQASILPRLGPSFRDPELESQFEKYWCRLTPIMVGIIVWRTAMTCSSMGMSMYMLHRERLKANGGHSHGDAADQLQRWSESPGAMMVLLLPLVPTAVSLLMCSHATTRALLRRWPHALVAANVVPFYVSQSYENVQTRVLSPTKRCNFGFCESTGSEALFISMHVATICFVNLLCPSLQRYKTILNAFMSLAMLSLLWPFYTHTGLFALLCCVVSQYLTLRVGRWIEGLYRTSVELGANLRKGRARMSNILGTMLPQRLLSEPLVVPLVERFDGVTVLFCSFRLDTSAELSSSFAAVRFVKLLAEIYNDFDEAVWQSGMYKVEHVGEDYVVCSPEVDGGDLGLSEEHARVLSDLAFKLVNIGTRHVLQARAKGLNGLQFKAGLHHGPVVAGIVGRTRRFYRLFGDTVVTAARICQSAPFGRVQISEEVDALIGEECNLRRGEWYSVPLKNKVPRRVRCLEGTCESYSATVAGGPPALDLCGSSLPILLTQCSSVSELERDIWEPCDDQDYLRTSMFSLFGTLGKDGNGAVHSSPVDMSAHGSGSTAIAATASSVEEGEILEKRRAEAGSYLSISRSALIILVPMFHLTGDNHGWTVPDKGTNTLPLFLGPTWAALLVASCLLTFALKRVSTLSSVQGIQVAQNVIFALGNVLALSCTSADSASHFMVPFFAQLACSSIDYRLATALSLPVVATTLVLVLIKEQVPSYALCQVWFSINIVAISVTVLAFLRLKNLHERNVRKKSHQVMMEHGVLSKLLTDLLPAEWAQRLIEDEANGEVAQDMVSIRQAVVLWSDLTGFTGLTEKLGADKIVCMMDRLWCGFDSLVQKRGAYKMDTVGDAYVVLGLVGEHGSREEICEMMLILSKEIVLLCRDYSNEIGESIGVRIGLDFGEIVSGVIGTLQPRFHAFGEVMASAQRLETACGRNSVLVSDVVEGIIGSERWDAVKAGDCIDQSQTSGAESSRVSSNSCPRFKSKSIDGRAMTPETEVSRFKRRIMAKMALPSPLAGSKTPTTSPPTTSPDFFPDCDSSGTPTRSWFAGPIKIFGRSFSAHDPCDATPALAHPSGDDGDGPQDSVARTSSKRKSQCQMPLADIEGGFTAAGAYLFPRGHDSVQSWNGSEAVRRCNSDPVDPRAAISSPQSQNATSEMFTRLSSFPDTDDNPSSDCVGTRSLSPGGCATRFETTLSSPGKGLLSVSVKRRGSLTRSRSSVGSSSCEFPALRPSRLFQEDQCQSESCIDPRRAPRKGSMLTAFMNLVHLDTAIPWSSSNGQGDSPWGGSSFTLKGLKGAKLGNPLDSSIKQKVVGSPGPLGETSVVARICPQTMDRSKVMTMSARDLLNSIRASGAEVHMHENERLSSVPVRSKQVARRPSDSRRRRSAFLDQDDNLTLPILAAEFKALDSSMPAVEISPGRFNRAATLRASSSPLSLRGHSQEPSPKTAVVPDVFSLGAPAPALSKAMKKLSRECSITGSSDHSRTADEGGNLNGITILVPGDPGYYDGGYTVGLARSLSDPCVSSDYAMRRSAGHMEAGEPERQDDHDCRHRQARRSQTDMQKSFERIPSADTALSATTTLTRVPTAGSCDSASDIKA